MLYNFLKVRNWERIFIIYSFSYYYTYVNMVIHYEAYMIIPFNCFNLHLLKQFAVSYMKLFVSGMVGAV